MEEDKSDLLPDRDTLTGSIWDAALDLIDLSSWGNDGLPVSVFSCPPKSSISENDYLTIIMESQETKTSFEHISPELENQATIQETELHLETVNDFTSLTNYCSQVENTLEQNRQDVITAIREKHAAEDAEAIDIFRKRMLAIAPYLTWLPLECINDISVEFADHSYEIYQAQCLRSFYAHFTESFGVVVEESEVGSYTVKGFEKKDLEDNPEDYELIITDECTTFTRESKPQSVYLNINNLVQEMIDLSEKSQKPIS